MTEEKKMGRSTDNPKSWSIRARLDAEADAVLETYYVCESVTRAEAIRRGTFLLSRQD